LPLVGLVEPSAAARYLLFGDKERVDNYTIESIMTV
jgi:hypothetical protein